MPISYAPRRGSGGGSGGGAPALRARLQSSRTLVSTDGEDEA